LNRTDNETLYEYLSSGLTTAEAIELGEAKIDERIIILDKTQGKIIPGYYKIFNKGKMKRLEKNELITAFVNLQFFVENQENMSIEDTKNVKMIANDMKHINRLLARIKEIDIYPDN
jgi:hypothetical protein